MQKLLLLFQYWLLCTKGDVTKLGWMLSSRAESLGCLQSLAKLLTNGQSLIIEWGVFVSCELSYNN